MTVYLIGLVSGVVGGMGIGGGAILIPALTLFMSLDQQAVQSINLIYFIPTAAAALIVHAKNKYIELKLAVSIIIFGILGSVIGSAMAVSIPSSTLKKMFGIFLFFMGGYEVLRRPNKIN